MSDLLNIIGLLVDVVDVATKEANNANKVENASFEERVRQLQESQNKKENIVLSPTSEEFKDWEQTEGEQLPPASHKENQTKTSKADEPIRVGETIQKNSKRKKMRQMIIHQQIMDKPISLRD